jgi:hypothetical protein
LVGVGLVVFRATVLACAILIYSSMEVL